MNPVELERWLSAQLPQWQAIRLESLVEVTGGWESDVYDLLVRHGKPQRDQVERFAQQGR
ncbi:MAG: hypothetical protein OEQ47_14835 [Acidimicrobiia bacterium]|nr:hypothetical protein [Acidimicrobiia bacterium]